MAQLFETGMLICFGCSWPLSVVKSFKARTAKGKSVQFTILIIIGYICGIMSKVVSGNINYVFALYILNIVMVSTDLVLWFRNRALDKKADREHEIREAQFKKENAA